MLTFQCPFSVVQGLSWEALGTVSVTRSQNLMSSADKMHNSENTRSALSVIPTPYRVRDKKLVESVGNVLDKPADEVTVGDMRSVARQKLAAAKDAITDDELAYGFAKTDAHNACRLLRWLSRHA